MVEKAALEPDYGASYKLHDQTSKFMDKMARKYGGPQKTLAHKYNAAWSELHNNLAMLEREIEQQSVAKMVRMHTTPAARETIEEMAETIMVSNPQETAERLLPGLKWYVQRKLNIPTGLWSPKLERFFMQIFEKKRTQLELRLAELAAAERSAWRRAEAADRKKDPNYRGRV